MSLVVSLVMSHPSSVDGYIGAALDGGVMALNRWR